MARFSRNCGFREIEVPFRTENSGATRRDQFTRKELNLRVCELGTCDVQQETLAYVLKSSTTISVASAGCVSETQSAEIRSL